MKINCKNCFHSVKPFKQNHSYCAKHDYSVVAVSGVCDKHSFYDKQPKLKLPEKYDNSWWGDYDRCK
jgi:hypothetical protein